MLNFVRYHLLNFIAAIFVLLTYVDQVNIFSLKNTHKLQSFVKNSNNYFDLASGIYSYCTLHSTFENVLSNHKCKHD